MRFGHAQKVEMAPTPERSREELEAQMEYHAHRLLTDFEGNPRIATSGHDLEPGLEPGHLTAEAHFYREDGGYVVEEFRDGGEEPIFISFMKPNPGYDPADQDSYKWDTGMLKMKWMRFSIYDQDNIEPVLGVLEAFFSEVEH